MKQQKLDLQNKSEEIEITQNATIVGTYIGRGSDKLSYRLNIVHNLPNLTSNTAIKAVLFDSAQAEFYGNLVINNGAKNTDAYLRIDVLLVGDKAMAKAEPGLEITQDSVKGGHGATIATVNDTELHYLMSRGISRDEAVNMIVEGFLQNT